MDRKFVSLLTLLVVFSLSFVSANGWCENADIDRDGYVNVNDYDLWYSHNGLTCDVGDWCDNTDINRDLQVTGADFSAWKSWNGSDCKALVPAEWVDVDGNEYIDGGDVDMINDAWVSNEYPNGCYSGNNYCSLMDVNRDGYVNVADRAMARTWEIVSNDLSCYNIDYDKDGDVDAMDILRYNGCLDNEDSVVDCSFFDFDEDGLVDEDDGFLMRRWTWQTCQNLCELALDNVEIVIDEGYTVIDRDTGELRIQVSALSIDVEEIRFIFTVWGDSFSEVWEEAPSINEERVFSIIDDRFMVGDDVNVEVSISPVIDGEICQISDSIIFAGASVAEVVGNKNETYTKDGTYIVDIGDKIKINDVDANVNEISWALQGDTEPKIRINANNALYCLLHDGESCNLTSGSVMYPEDSGISILVNFIVINEENPILSNASITITSFGVSDDEDETNDNEEEGEDDESDDTFDNNDSNDEQEEENESQIFLGDCIGCVLNERCFSLGYRKGLNGSLFYCSEEGFVEQKLAEESCDNHFECESNVCVSGKCIESGFLQRIINWFVRLFG